MALKTRMSDAPSVTTLTRAVEGGGRAGAPGPGAEGLVPSRRIAVESDGAAAGQAHGRACVVASVNIPAEHVDLLAFAERTLAARLSELRDVTRRAKRRDIE